MSRPRPGPRPRAGGGRPRDEAVWEGEVERLSWGGLGISRLDDGRVLLLEAPKAIFPGETVRARIKQKPKHAEGEIVSWIKPSPLRAAHACSAAGECGGCDLQEAGELHSDLKCLMVEDLFHRQLPSLSFEWLPAPDGALRHRIQLHWDGKNIGFHRRRTHSVVPAESCPAALPLISGAIPRLRDAISAKLLPTRPQRWELAAGTPPKDVFAIDDTKRVWLLEPDGWKRTDLPITHAIPGMVLTQAPGGFFQVSSGWAVEAFGAVFAKWGIGGDTLFDLYGGVGLFSAMLRDKFKGSVLVEADIEAVAHARQNLGKTALSHECVEADVAAWLKDDFCAPGDVVLLDPPRAGLPPDVARCLQKAKAGALILIGCDGATFCRDLKVLSQTWEVERLAAIDLFPVTVHVECVAMMKKRSAEPRAMHEQGQPSGFAQAWPLPKKNA
jgi:23S rRNA (uracil1939-C5)-methyltransferase